MKNMFTLFVLTILILLPLYDLPNFLRLGQTGTCHTNLQNKRRFPLLTREKALKIIPSFCSQILVGA